MGYMVTHTQEISIHAPRAGSDRHRLELLRPHDDFNPRSPHGERLYTPHGINDCEHFNPRSPHGERPLLDDKELDLVLFQSTLPARGATATPHIRFRRRNISIHAPRTGSDGQRDAAGKREEDFNPRSPHGERRERIRQRGGGTQDFNPRSPHGERQERGVHHQRRDGEFQSTLPARGATDCGFRVESTHAISIHAPRTGSDV